MKQDEEEEPRETDALIEGEEVKIERFPHLQKDHLCFLGIPRAETGDGASGEILLFLSSSFLKRLFQLESAVVHETPEGAVDLGSEMEETEVS